MALPAFRVHHSMPGVQHLRVLRPVFVRHQRDWGEGRELLHFLLDGELPGTHALREGAVLEGMPVVGDAHAIKLVADVVDDRHNLGCFVGIGQGSSDEVVLHVNDDKRSLGFNHRLTRHIKPQEGPQLVDADGAVLVEVKALQHELLILLSKSLAWEGILHEGRQLGGLQEAVLVVVVLLEDLLREEVGLATLQHRLPRVRHNITGNLSRLVAAHLARKLTLLL
mmetsp:Transcript_60691/g.144658  ORF Transcript_60691/g.144658 Transcript_60691/m.144658 type:complete len:224 (+) Transcript_60691:510-1181(+)